LFVIPFVLLEGPCTKLAHKINITMTKVLPC